MEHYFLEASLVLSPLPQLGFAEVSEGLASEAPQEWSFPSFIYAPSYLISSIPKSSSFAHLDLLSPV